MLKSGTNSNPEKKEIQDNFQNNVLLGLNNNLHHQSESEESKSISVIDQKKLEIGEFFLEKHLSKKKQQTNIKKWDSYLKKLKKSKGLMNSSELPMPATILHQNSSSPSNSCSSSLTFDTTIIQLFYKKSQSKFISKVNHSPGPPMKYRFICWRTIMNISNGFPDVFLEMKKQTLPKVVERDIKYDLHRTYPSHPLFIYKQMGDTTLGEKQLYSVLRALANNFPRIGYCQGMNFVVGFLLLISGGNEAESFNFFQKMGLDWRFHILGLFEDNFPLVNLYVFIFWKLMKENQDDLKKHLEKLGVPDHAWISKWFMMLYLYSLPLDVVCRVWDFIISEENLLSLLKIALALMKILKPDLMRFQEIFEIMEYFKILKGGLYEPYKSALIDEETIKSKNITLKGDILVRKARKIKLSKKIIAETTKEFLQLNPQFKNHVIMEYYLKYDGDFKEMKIKELKLKEYFLHVDENTKQKRHLSFEHLPILAEHEEFMGVNKLKNIPLFEINNLVIFQSKKKKVNGKNNESDEEEDDEDSISEGEFATNKSYQITKIPEKASFH